ncbi:hypothetical protein [Thalassoglobus polymorphus]|uniref:Uncharacterized protein n=1 Tax=Thalassoglobus polymorphus TaxID=2527994 RepID=A0A517QHS7_9PLAN|nr:hypothetical protein [Thalassoglobus polymorphus]QDT31185.1 hypothetical protein Mal48_04170 [Thalassoglobus polymorphus]
MPVRIFATILVLSIASSTHAQIHSGGGFGGGGGLDNETFRSSLQASSAPYVETDNILITISKTGKTVTAFSALTGKTASLSFEEKVEPFVPIVSGNLACFAHNKSAYAFIATTGKWQAVKTKTKNAQFIHSGTMACFVEGKTAYAIGDQTGKWLQIDAEEVPIPSFTTTMVKFQVKSKIYICSATSKEWQVIDLESDGK